MTAKPKSIDDYLAPLSAKQRAALEKLRQTIRAAAPKAEECISYQLPAFRLNGKFLVAFGAALNHCAFYPGAFPIEACQAQLKRYDTSKGTIRFQADKPLPGALVRKLVQARIAERTGRSRKSE
ncbi:MAG: iron chaperone [Candidatus Acidiferrales bacterium]